MPETEPSAETHRATLFPSGRNQALRIPKAFELPGEEVLIRREGDRLVIEPIKEKKGLLAVLAEFGPLEEEFPDTDEGLLPLKDIQLG